MHTVTVCTVNEYKNWQEEDLFLNYYLNSSTPDRFYTREDVIEYAVNHYGLDKQELYAMNSYELGREIGVYGEFYTYDYFMDNDKLKTHTTHYTSPSGDELVIVSQFGFDY